ncbi:other/AgaK1 protein kinase [Coprinopsis sp. MPI-PUGE-AT-0042]|nr:other/AgaK1 protein kinase [Coprinopsis sp. MPI-PUGE-AT-0042]
MFFSSKPPAIASEVEPLATHELFWRDHYSWFAENGYRLRNRYKPDWTAQGKWIRDLGREETWNYRISENINDAIRESDNAHVVLKRVPRDKYPEELKIMNYFCEESLAADPRNHCIPILDTLQPPDYDDEDIIVLPVLREYDEPPFDTIGEAVDYIRQVLEGFTFLHEHRVAHRDIKGENILMDHTALGIPRFNYNSPDRTYNGEATVNAKFSRTERRPKYLIIDFGFSTQIPDDTPTLLLPKPASDTTLPELQELDTPCDPFLSDVYYVGNMLRMEFIEGDPARLKREGFYGFEFLLPLIEAMIKKDPKDRISMGRASTMFDEIVAKLPTSKLRSRPELRGQYYLSVRAYNSTRHWVKWLKYAIQRLPPIPEGKPSTT